MKTRVLHQRVARAVAAVAAVLVTVSFFAAPPAAADHTPLPSAVTLVGTLQSELGCSGDWQPECAATHLQPVSGSPGVFRATFDLPAGAHEYKVALNDSWSENYGAGGAAGGANIAIAAPGGPVTFTYDHSTHLITDDVPDPLTGDRAAQWLRRGVIAWDLPPQRTGFTYRIYWAEHGGLTNSGGTITGGSSAPLRLLASGLPAGVRRAFPQLASFEALRPSPAVRRQIAHILTGQIAVAAFDAVGTLVAVTGVQTAGVLDDLYRGAAARHLGPVWTWSGVTLAVWAPTAKKVSLLLDPSGPAPERLMGMHRDTDGVWSVRGAPSWRGATYLYEATVYAPTTDKVVLNRVTDPYSLALTTNSERSVVVNLQDRALRPAGWNHLVKPALPKPEYSSIYELHVRDFSIHDRTVPTAHRGTYLAFTDRNSNGMRHLRRLARSGMNTLHLLPVNDIASIEERRAVQQVPACDLASFAPDSEQQQACVTAVAAEDGFNWGYDPLHYTTPEGSYATEPNGPARTKQFRQMVEGVNRAGMRVVTDVVYNHTPAAGQDPNSILDRIVPGYYQRLSATGAVETSTCCANTATEHRMMGKLLIDSVLTWATQYKIDGFRFDLMGHQPKQVMLDLRAALNRLTLRKDGVDGSRIYLYGEGWNFGEVADDARFVQATQANLAGTGIGTFNDRLRDAVRGGGPFDADPRIQGFASGLYTDPNGDPANGTTAEQKARLLLAQDQIKVALTGNLKGYRFIDRTGARVSGAQVDYNGQPAGYTADPQEAVNYVDAHDNETLYDALVYKLPMTTPMAQRIRMQNLALATTALSQGVSFWQAGSDILRSKSLDRNSYDSGDWFNVLDWSYQRIGFGRGLRPSPTTKRSTPSCGPRWLTRRSSPPAPTSSTRKHRPPRCWRSAAARPCSISAPPLW